MRDHRTRWFSLLVVAGFALTALGGVANAHEFEETAKLSIHKNKANPYDVHEVVVFKGNVGADRKFCKGHRLVILYKGQQEMDRDFTGARGRYKVSRTLAAPGTKKFHTEVTSKIGGQHPHRHVCFGDTSRTVTVKVIQQP